jgi:hypothetical protein
MSNFFSPCLPAQPGASELDPGGVTVTLAGPANEPLALLPLVVVVVNFAPDPK